MAVLSGCSHNGPDSPVRDIRLAAGIPNDSEPTKALLESEDINHDGTVVRVFGFTDGDTPSLPGHKILDGTEGTTDLNGGLSIKYSSGAWGFVKTSDGSATGEAYQWKSGVTHRFFGWLDTDAKSSLEASTFFGSGFSYAAGTGGAVGTGTLTVPAKALGISDSNMDFAYSDVVVRSATGGDFSQVVLPLNHLFASFSLSARNYMTSSVIITGVTIKGLKDSKGATVSFGDEAAAVVYGTGSMMSDTQLVTGGNVTLARAGNSGDTYKNIVQGASTTAMKYFLVWPQTLEEAEAATLTVDYYIGSTSAPLQHKTFELPHDSGFSDDALNGWAAGVRHMMELSFHDKEVSLGVYAANWYKNDPIVEYDGSISVSQPISIPAAYASNCIAGLHPGEYYFTTSRLPIVLQFKFDQPENSTWLVSKNGDFDAFTVANFEDNGPAEGIIDPNGGLSKIVINPPTGELSKNEYRLSLSFTVRKNSGDMENVPDAMMYGAGNPVMTFILLK